jgi:hypothetical protein
MKVWKKPPVSLAWLGATNSTLKRGYMLLATRNNSTGRPWIMATALAFLGAPSRLAQAAAPLLFGVLIDAFGAGTSFFSAALGLSALAALCMVQR